MYLMAKKNSVIIYSDPALRNEIEETLKKIKEWGYEDATITDASYVVANKSKLGFMAKFQIINLLRKRRGLL